METKRHSLVNEQAEYEETVVFLFLREININIYVEPLAVCSVTKLHGFNIHQWPAGKLETG